MSVTPDLFVSGTANGQQVQMLVDTGAAVSVLSAEFAMENHLAFPSTRQNDPNSTNTVMTVSGEKLPILGHVEVVIGMNDDTYPTDLLIISGLGYDIVLGRDFLKSTN